MPSRNQKVVHLTTVHPPFDTRIFHKEAKTLADAGYDVCLIVTHDKREIVDGIKIIPLPKARNRFFRIFGSTWRAFWLAFKQRADIYHFHDPELIPVGMLLKFVTRSKVIYDVHEDYKEVIKTRTWLPPIIKSLLSMIFDIVERIFSYIFDQVIGATDNISRKFPNYKTITIKNYPSMSFIKNENVESRDYFTSRQQVYKLIYVGGLSEPRGIFELVQAMGIVDDNIAVKLKLLGKFSNKDFENKIKLLDGYKKVDYLGLVSYKEVYNNLIKADIGLACFHPEDRYKVSEPNKLFEYMSAGLPIIASNFQLWKGIFNNVNCGILVNPLDPKEIAQAIEYLIDNPDEMRKMGDNGLQAVKEKYNWDIEKEKLLEAYRKLAKP